MPVASTTVANLLLAGCLSTIEANNERARWAALHETGDSSPKIRGRDEATNNNKQRYHFLGAGLVRCNSRFLGWIFFYFIFYTRACYTVAALKSDEMEAGFLPPRLLLVKFNIDCHLSLAAVIAAG